MWKMYRIWMDTTEQREFIGKMIENNPSFPFSFNRYSGLKATGERDHIQFRFPEEYKKEADEYLEKMPQFGKDIFDWKEHKNTILTAMVASKCSLLFMKEFECNVRPNTLVLSEFLHFFLDDLELSYLDEYLLYSTSANFFQNLMGVKNKEKNEQS